MRGLLARAVGCAILIAAAYLILGPTFLSLPGLLGQIESIFVGILL